MDSSLASALYVEYGTDVTKSKSVDEVWSLGRCSSSCTVETGGHSLVLPSSFRYSYMYTVRTFVLICANVYEQVYKRNAYFFKSKQNNFKNKYADVEVRTRYLGYVPIIFSSWFQVIFAENLERVLEFNRERNILQG